jgi:DNA polymerase-3 subunit epsilon
VRTRLVERLPRAPRPSDDAYLELLDRSLLDRRTHLDPGELRALARPLGVTDLEALHRQYLGDLAAIGRDLDPVAAGRPDLTEIAGLLHLPDEAVEAAMSRAENDPADFWRLEPGDTVVFAGSLAPSRDRWLSEARDAGLVVGNAVTRRTRLLVTADPQARTGNAEKARRYQVPIVHPAAYREILRRAGPLRRNSRF